MAGPEHPRPKIPEDRADEFDLVIDVSLMRRDSFDQPRAWHRIRANVAEVYAQGLDALERSVRAQIDAVIGETLVVPPKQKGAKRA